MHERRLLSVQEIVAFEKLLTAPHHKVVNNSGYTTYWEGVMMHNLRALRSTYGDSPLEYDRLANAWGVSEDAAREFAEYIAENRWVVGRAEDQGLIVDFCTYIDVFRHEVN